MRYRISHRTTYAYSAPVHESFNEVRLRPASDETQTCLDFGLAIDPPATVITFADYYGNDVHDFSVPYLHQRLTIEATSDVVTFAGIDQPLSGPRGDQPDQSPPVSGLAADQIFTDDHAEFLVPSTYVALDALTEGIAHGLLAADPGVSAYGFLRAAAAWVRERLAYRIGTTTVHSTVAEVLAGGSGVCQDFSHVLIPSAGTPGCRPGTSAGIWATSPRARRPTPGSRRSSRRTAGSASTRPAAGHAPAVTSRSPWAATMPTSPSSVGLTGAGSPLSWT
jgi:transglutaminase-like putative cysteine protease